MATHQAEQHHTAAELESPRAGRKFHAANMTITTSDFGVVIVLCKGKGWEKFRKIWRLAVFIVNLQTIRLSKIVAKFRTTIL
jgi:hypothetical protein